MGHLQAQEMAAQADLDMRVALHWHLTANHYPPLPAEYTETCVQAIDFAAQAVVEDDEDLWDTLLDLPNVSVVPRNAVDGQITVGEFVSATNLEAFVDVAVAKLEEGDDDAIQ